MPRYARIIIDQSVPVLKAGIQSYQNEDTLGAAIRASGKPRESFFVTTKLSSVPEPGDTVSDALRKSLARLGLGVFQLVSRNIKAIDTPRQITLTFT